MDLSFDVLMQRELRARERGREGEAGPFSSESGRPFKYDDVVSKEEALMDLIDCW